MTSSTLLGRFAEFLKFRVDHIVDQWLRDVRADPKLPTSDSLPEPTLKDHIPKLIEWFIEAMRRSEEQPQVGLKLDADKHGAVRWEQGYSIKELVWELSKLRKVLMDYATEFTAEQGFASPEHRTLFQFIDCEICVLESRSVDAFVEEKEADLMESNNSRLRLIRTVSHELRNMLNSIGLVAEQLAEIGSGEVSSIHEVLERNVRHMTEVLDSLLNLSSVLTGQNPIKLETFSLKTLLHSLEGVYGPLARDKGLALSVSIDPRLDTVVNDEVKVRQIFENLVSNAIKYTAKGDVKIAAEPEDEAHWSATVTDTGRGIPKGDQGNIFGEFFRVAEDAKTAGSGIGLSIVSNLVRALGGKIEVISQEGVGSSFRVVLPYKKE
jgi:signal transduction histidine kinase